MKLIEERKRMRGQGGFTLIELLVVIAILAVLGGAAVIGIGSLRGNAQKQACRTDKATIETALEAYDVDNPTPGVATIAILKSASPPYLKKVDAADWTVTYAGGSYTVANTTGATGGKYKSVTTADCD